jgi:preprotein translocase subunit Sss1
MDGNIIGLVAVTMALGIPIAAMYTFYRVRKLRTDERMAALARGVDVPMQPELSQVAQSRRSGILLSAGAIGYIITFGLIAKVEPDAWMAASFGIIPLAIGVGFFVDAFLVRRDLRAS